jgi:AmmeMemoRadiSam system protein B
LRAFLKSSFDSAAAIETAKVRAFQAPRAIISPHLDPREASSSYALAYDEIRPYRYDLFVVLGTAHGPAENLFTATGKDFATPLGTVKTHQSLVSQLGKRYGKQLFEDEYLHKSEHSVEFQCLYLQYLFGSRHEFFILPILCGSFQHLLEQRKPADSMTELADFTGLLRELLKSSGMKVCLIASADLSHVGLRFGDSRPIDDGALAALKIRDLEKIGYLEKLDPAGFWAVVRQEKDSTRICGFPCIYTMLTLLGKGKGTLLHYGQMDDRQTGSAVSYASLVFP